MAGHDRSPQHQPRADPGDTWERAHGPYLCFVAAFLRQAVTDARRTPKGTGSWTENTDGGTAGRQREAQEFLLDLNRLAPWVELTGADVDKMQGVLLQAAGLASTPSG
jgi:hypothetical protein